MLFFLLIIINLIVRQQRKIMKIGLLRLIQLQIAELEQEIAELKDKLLQTESDLRQSELENRELKDHCEKLEGEVEEYREMWIRDRADLEWYDDGYRKQ